MKNAEGLAAEMATQYIYMVIITGEMQVKRKIHELALGQEYINFHSMDFYKTY